MRCITWNDRKHQVCRRRGSQEPKERRLSTIPCRVSPEELQLHKRDTSQQFFNVGADVLFLMQQSLSLESTLMRAINVGRIGHAHGKALYHQITSDEPYVAYSEHASVPRKTSPYQIVDTLKTISTNIFGGAGHNVFPGSIITLWGPSHTAPIRVPALCRCCTSRYFFLVWLSVTGCAELRWSQSSHTRMCTLIPEIGGVYLINTLADMVIVPHQKCKDTICMATFYQHSVTSCNACVPLSSPASPVASYGGPDLTSPMYAPNSPDGDKCIESMVDVVTDVV